MIKSIKSAMISDCGDLVGSPNCGYCAATDEFYYGTKKVQRLKYVQKKIGVLVEGCEKVKDRQLCSEVKDCGGVGRKSRRKMRILSNSRYMEW